MKIANIPASENIWPRFSTYHTMKYFGQGF